MTRCHACSRRVSYEEPETSQPGAPVDDCDVRANLCTDKHLEKSMRAVICFVGLLTLLAGAAALEGQQETEIRIATEGGGMFVTRSVGDGPGSLGAGSTRTVPVGTATLTGTVTAIASGRPLNNVRLALTASTDAGSGVVPGATSANVVTILAVLVTTSFVTGSMVKSMSS